MIQISCSCGRTLSVPDSAAGKRGKCPKCGAIVRVPEAAKAEEELELAEVAPRAVAGHFPAEPRPVPRGGEPAAGPVPTVDCPNCQASWPQETIFCVRCGTEIATGRGVGSRRPVGARFRSDGPADDVPFWRATLGFFTSYADTIAALPARLERPSFRWKVLAFYAAAWIVLAIPFGWLAMKADSALASASAPAASGSPEWTRLMGAGNYEAKISSPEGTLGAGKKTVFRVEVRDAKTKAPSDVQVWMSTTIGASKAGRIAMDPDSEPGSFVAEATLPAGTKRVYAHFDVEPRGGSHLEGSTATLYHAFPVGGTGSESAPRSIMGFFLILGAIVVVGWTFSAAFHSALIKLAATILGDQGSWLTMFLATIYLQALMVITLSGLALLPWTVFGIGAVLMVPFSIIFLVRVVMAVFGQSGWKAFATVVVAGVLNAVIGGALSSGLGILGMLAAASRVGGHP